MKTVYIMCIDNYTDINGPYFETMEEANEYRYHYINQEARQFAHNRIRADKALRPYFEALVDDFVENSDLTHASSVESINF